MGPLKLVIHLVQKNHLGQFDDVDNLVWHPIGPKDAPQTFPVHAVKSLLKVYKLI